MTYTREHRGISIRLDGAWSNDNQSNLYTWRVIDSQRVIPLESKHPFTDWHECYADATKAIDAFLQMRGGLA